jgi:hypothetical protein
MVRMKNCRFTKAGKVVGAYRGAELWIWSIGNDGLGGPEQRRKPISIKGSCYGRMAMKHNVDCICKGRKYGRAHISMTVFLLGFNDYGKRLEFNDKRSKACRRGCDIEQLRVDYVRK